MAVLLPNARLTVRKRAHDGPTKYERDDHGYPVASAAGLGDPIGPYDGAVIEPDDTTPAQAAYRLRVDPRCHPMRPDDEVKDDEGRTFVVRTAKLVSVPGNDAVDFIRVTADLDPPQVP